MTENEQKKEYLNRYKDLCRKLRSLEEQLLALKEVEESAKIQNISDMPKGGKQTDLSDYIVKLDKVFTQILKTRSKCMRLMIEIEGYISDMPDGIESSIIHKRYIELKTWEQICVEINYSWKQTHRKHSSALQHLVMPLNDDI